MKEEKLEKEKPKTEIVNLNQRKRKEPSKPSLPASSKMLKFSPTVDLFEPINCWWEKELNKNGQQWSYLEHHGLMFTTSYKPHNIPINYKNKEIVLPPAAEEVSNFWCSASTSAYGTKEKFIKNFWSALLCKLPSDHILKKEGAEFHQVDFSNIKTHLDELTRAAQEKRKAMTKEEREKAKREREQEEGPFSYALFDWLREKNGTYKTEPPGLFRGRGEHPKMGLLKRRIFPEDVVLNCHEDAPVPRLHPDMQGHAWKDVYFDPTVSWLCYYRDSVNSQCKYTFLGAGSSVKGLKDYLKYEKARRLGTRINIIRKDYRAKMQADNIVDKQLGTATYMLDILALRVGNEKDSDEEADTVGCCSLRKEHITFNKKASTITLDFLGKDSIRYLNTVKVDSLAFRNLSLFCDKKSASADIFDRISTGVLNRYLRDLMPSLSAKVFRTYNASITLQNELDKLDASVVDISSPDSIKQFYDCANRTVAILCNHQRSIPKQHEVSMDKLKEQLAKTTEAMNELQCYNEWLQKPHEKNEVFRYHHKSENQEENFTSVVKAGLKKDAVQRKIAQLTNKKKSQLLRINMKDANKTVASSTSKQHYMDPRISVSFCKKWELPVEKIFNTTLRKKFPWAMYARCDFVF
ncbi:DNA topoisomerase I, mitochondrial-like isoform X2 [Hylaeus volcanicus]|uniref:DNA topoisomerase I, mitochondrial-like isoform X2 n=1 Tax=Hylaeus volcanicus TaxID=313075 RepID=UPI0023B8082B|nr:DNA topoisomerase I, mitochondrial-like isoform X2 [Hylaeus volcanicus]